MRTRDEVLDALVEIRDEVDTLAQAAELLGMTRSALDKVLERARKDGDPRAQWRGLGWRLGQTSRLTPEDAYAEVTHLTEGGIGWDEAVQRVGIKPRTRLMGDINRLRRTA